MSGVDGAVKLNSLHAPSVKNTETEKKKKSVSAFVVEKTVEEFVKELIETPVEEFIKAEEENKNETAIEEPIQEETKEPIEEPIQEETKEPVEEIIEVKVLENIEPVNTLEATKKQIDNQQNRPGTDASFGYGYCFWKNSIDEDSFRADGMFSQFGIGIPEYDATIVVTSAVTDETGCLDYLFKYFPRAFE